MAYLGAGIVLGLSAGVTPGPPPVLVLSPPLRPGVREGTRVAAAPPPADPQLSTVHLYYEVENPRRELRPGQRLRAAVPLRGSERSLGVPWSAVLFDLVGGSWVYQRVEPGAAASP